MELGTPYELMLHRVCGVTRTAGTPAVLKLGLPGAEHLGVEAAALKVYDGRGAVRLLEYDAAAGALLLERAEPGTPASTLAPTDDEAVIAVLHRLHVPVLDCRRPELTSQAAYFAAYLRLHPADGPLHNPFGETYVPVVLSEVSVEDGGAPDGGPLAVARRRRPLLS